MKVNDGDVGIAKNRDLLAKSLFNRKFCAQLLIKKCSNLFCEE